MRDYIFFCSLLIEPLLFLKWFFSGFYCRDEKLTNALLKGGFTPFEGLVHFQLCDIDHSSEQEVGVLGVSEGANQHGNNLQSYRSWKATWDTQREPWQPEAQREAGMAGLKETCPGLTERFSHRLLLFPLPERSSVTAQETQMLSGSPWLMPSAFDFWEWQKRELQRDLELYALWKASLVLCQLWLSYVPPGLAAHLCGLSSPRRIRTQTDWRWWISWEAKLASICDYLAHWWNIWVWCCFHRHPFLTIGTESKTI